MLRNGSKQRKAGSSKLKTGIGKTTSAPSLCALSFALCALSCCLAGCASERVPEKPAYDYSRIRKISVVAFEGPNGSVVSDEVVKALLSSGIEVTDSKHRGDAVLKGTVTEYKPNNQLTVFLGNTTLLGPGGQSTVTDNPVVSLAGLQATPEGTNPGIHNAQVLSIVASVGVFASLIDPSTKNVLWTGSYSYEGLNVQETLRTVADVMKLSMAKVVPGIHK